MEACAFVLSSHHCNAWAHFQSCDWIGSRVCVCDLFERESRELHGILSRTRGATRRHDMQFKELVTIGGHTEVFKRSCFGLLTIWNMLPEDVVRSRSVKSFQRSLQNALVVRAQSREDFESFFEDARQMPISRFQRFVV